AVWAGLGARGREPASLVDELPEPFERPPHASNALLRELDGIPVVRLEQVDAERIGIVASQERLDRERVAERLRHLLGPEVHEAVVEPVAREGLPGRRLGLGDLTGVVRENEVLAPTVEIERLAEVLHRHGGAFDVPARAARTPRARPRGLAGLC